MKIASAMRKKNPGKPWQSYVKAAGKEVKASGVAGTKKRKSPAKSKPAKKAVSRAKVVVIAGTKSRSNVGGAVARAQKIEREMKALDLKYKAAKSYAVKMVIYKAWKAKEAQLKKMA